MGRTKMSMSPGEASDRFNEGIRLFGEDGEGGLRYILLRLELAGLTEQDQRNLGDLVAIACQGQDVMESADRVRKVESASPLAVAIADIVQKADSHRKAAALGAVFGAHGAVGSGGDPIEAAVAGAVAASSIALIDDRSLGGGLDQFLVRGRGDELPVTVRRQTR
jgi:hypothetical protein